MRSRLALLLGALSLAAFVLLGLAARSGPLWPDARLVSATGDWWQRPSAAAVSVASDLIGPVLAWAAALAMVITTIVLWRKGERRVAGTVFRCLLLLGACQLTNWIGKPLFDRARPRAYPDPSYPSGHVVSTASVGFVAVLLCVCLAPTLVRNVSMVAVLLTALCAISRVLLGVHWVSDTVGAVLGVLGTGLLGCVALCLPNRAAGTAPDGVISRA